MWSSLGLAAIVAAAVSTGTSLLVTSGIAGTWQLVNRLFQSRRADNITLSSDGYRQDQGGRLVLMCVVRCAPSRRLLFNRPIDHVLVGDFARAITSDLPDGLPAISREDEVRYQTPGPMGFGPETFVSVRSSGLIEFATPISGTALDERPEDGTMPVALEEIAGHVSAVVEQVQGGLYRRLFGTRRRLDWALSVGASVRVELTNQTQFWSDLTIGGVPIGDRAVNARPESPIQNQFGARQLRNLWPRTKPEDIIQPALTDWLRRSGYLKPDQAVDVLIAQLNGLIA